MKLQDIYQKEYYLDKKAFRVPKASKELLNRFLFRPTMKSIGITATDIGKDPHNFLLYKAIPSAVWARLGLKSLPKFMKKMFRGKGGKKLLTVRNLTKKINKVRS